MVWFAYGSLILWPAVVFALFERMPTRRAIVFAFVTAWLFLPPIVIFLPGVPDWSKTTATVASVFLVLLLKDPARLMAFRPRWFDLPVLVFSVCPFASALSIGTGPYEGASLALGEMLMWGMPYLIGRIYLNDLAGARLLTSGIAVGGLLYVPLCLVEIRLSPILKTWVYGLIETNIAAFGTRYGGFRPSGFLVSGLELGWWMCCASLCAYLLVASRATRRWFDLPAVPLVWGLVVVTVACKSTGALAQMAVGFLLIVVARLTKSTLPIWLLVLVPPTYCLARPSGYFSAAQLSSYLERVFAEERVQSASFRFKMEDSLAQIALQRPILGWTPNGGYDPADENGNRKYIPDGYWIIVFCTTGSLGLVLLNAMMLLPSALFLRRYPVRIWMTPEIAPLLALAVILPLCMVDNLSNAMLNPIYAIAMGVVAGCGIGRRGVDSPDRGAEDDAAEDEGLARAIAAQARLVRARPYGHHLDHLALLRVRRARLLATRGRLDLARAERTAAEDHWCSADTPGGGTPWGPDRAANANDLAWLLAGAAGAGTEALDRARRLAEGALAGDPGRAPFWNTLGIVCYRQGDHHRAIHALSRSVTIDRGGGTAFDFYYLALANLALGYRPAANAWADRAESWRRAHPELGPALAPARAEFEAATPEPAA